MTGVNISERFVRYAKEAERERPLVIRYDPASAVELPFEEASFDFATAFMSLMDIPETGRVLTEGIFSAAPPEIREDLRPFRVPRFTRTLSEWLNLLVKTSFVLERFGEPYPSDEAVRERPGPQDAQIVAYFLHVRARKVKG
jgi:hypothetical protein